MSIEVAVPPAEPDALIAPPFGLSPVSAGPELDRRVAWWREARFGLFIHFGLYAIPGRGEWVMWNEQIPHREYARLADQFKPDPQAPLQWIAAAKAAGMKYVVLTARHHDGFSLFDSRANAFNSMRTAARQDIVRTFVTTARAEGLRVGLYYSPLDWRFPGYFFPDLYMDSAEAMREQYHAELEQLSSEYGHLDLLWYDGGGEQWLGYGGIEWAGGGWRQRAHDRPYPGQFSWQDDVVNARLRERQPAILINDRTTTPGDWRTREGAGNLGGFENATPWELCLTLAGAWGYQPNVKPRSFEELVLLITNTASRDGNLLLNVGPSPDGHVPADQVARLTELGQWLKRHGSAIYGTRGGPFPPTAQLSTTRRGNTIFLHVLPRKDAAPPRHVVVPAFADGPTLRRARVLGAPAELHLEPALTGGFKGVRLTLPDPTPQSPTIVVELSFDGSVMDLPVRDVAWQH